MNRLRSILIGNRYYFLTFLFFFLLGVYIILSEGKAASFFSLNPYHSVVLDAFFVKFTLLGDGIFALVVFLIMLVLRRYSQAWQLLVAFLASALCAQLLKSYFSMPRPKQFFNPGQYAYFIDGVTHIGFSSFPSGHSTSVFTLATMLALFEKNKRWNVCYLLAAVAVGYSRIYLGQHFLGDVLMGSLLGTLLSVLVHWLFTRRSGSQVVLNS
ncbi:MAG: phosphatase PAP2 family protein [Bacteroidota bacterium]|nr:phosphatase PAP2 family protein [Bacteroidota bacterium]MDP4215215.1 phosphatase PAP2 family protein [Bacteroidota bacterium]MDP4248187.1 phosphatase PAP2 family protein [Bacteroidota bacterium]MDP4254556.1 phosphatase PAP2 family protein [Bacteroidota bacterium]MDP4260004.1 phosphatase PAP2 family protein [Bacteroidota bacterium]